MSMMVVMLMIRDVDEANNDDGVVDGIDREGSKEDQRELIRGLNTTTRRTTTK